MCVRAMSSAFDYVQCAVTGAGAAHQVHENVEDAFIDEMAMGPLLWKNARRKLRRDGDGSSAVEERPAQAARRLHRGHRRRTYTGSLRWPP